MTAPTVPPTPGASQAEEVSFPRVSVVIPALNEERAIAGCLERFITQDYPLDRLEILVADGRSQDRTREIIQELAEKHTYPTIRLVDNPERITPCALNAGIQHSTGEIVIIFGAHSYAETDYVSQTVRTLAETDAGAVGGALDEIGHNFMGNAIGAARNSLIGGAISPHRYSTQPGYADTVRFAGYRREVFHAAGLFDPELVRNQDDEFNYRVRASGFKLYFNPAIRATYYTRGSFQRLWRQLYQYGYWKPRVLQKNPSCFSVQFLIPPLFVVTLVGFALLGWFWKPAWALLALELLTYTLLTGAFATKIALKRGGKFWLPVFLCYWVIHLSIGLGTLAGLSRLATPLKPAPKLALDTATTAVQS